MKTPTKIPDFLTGKTFTEEILQILAEHFPEFNHTHQQFLEATTRLKEDHLCDLKDPIDQQISCVLLFCGFLGAKANLDHFLDPIANCFLDTDAEIYLRRAAFSTLPDYRAAQITLDSFYEAITPEQQPLYDKVTDYLCYIETAGPYLAHYLGYLYAEKLYSRIIPGYYQHPGLTLRYQRMLETYFGKSLFL